MLKKIYTSRKEQPYLSIIAMLSILSSRIHIANALLGVGMGILTSSPSLGAICLLDFHYTWFRGFIGYTKIALHITVGLALHGINYYEEKIYDTIADKQNLANVAMDIGSMLYVPEHIHRPQFNKYWIPSALYIANQALGSVFSSWAPYNIDYLLIQTYKNFSAKKDTGDSLLTHNQSAIVPYNSTELYDEIENATNTTHHNIEL